MAIQDLLEDASFLVHNGRYLGALTMLLVAIAASSKKTFPHGTKSRENPTDKMSDREAFTLFLGGRVRKILCGDYWGPDEGSSGILVDFRKKQHDLAFILYKYYRCELMHEGELPEDVEFSAPKECSTGLTLINQDMQVSISSGNTMVLDHGWINLLQKAVKYARCNGAEFGIKHFDFLPLPGVDEKKFLDSLVEKYRTSVGRVQILRNAVRLISPDAITGARDETIAHAFSKLIESQQIGIGAITGGLAPHAFTDSRGVLQQRGIDLLREIASAYRIIVVS